MNKGKKLLKSFMVCVLVASMTLTANATGLYDQEKDLEDKKEQVEQEHKSLQDQVTQLTASMQQAEREIDAKELQIEQTEEELLQAKLEQNRQYEGMKLRMQYMYENGNESYLQILLESESMMDFFTKAEYITSMSKYDRKKLDDFTTVVHQVEEKELQLKADYESLEQLRVTLTTERQKAEKLLAEKGTELEKLDSDLKDIRQQIEDAQNTGSNPGDEDDGAGPQGSVVSGNGRFTHPCPGYSYISSVFGEVRHGINDPNAHKGIDYAAAKKTPIYAADAGKVIIARWSNSAGYWVVIDHGGGLVTKYMHMYKMPFVREGQRVTKGQHIGGVGTTGFSTGNHLHFQVEVNGKAVNPAKYL